MNRLGKSRCKALLREYIDSERLDDDERESYVNDIIKENERTGVLLATASLENALQKLIISNLPNCGDDDPIKPSLLFGVECLASFAAAIVMARAMDLIDEATREDLKIVKDIRNAFAHSQRPIRFSWKGIGDYCSYFNNTKARHAKAKPYAQFVMICTNLSTAFINKGSAILKERMAKIESDLSKIQSGLSKLKH